MSHWKHYLVSIATLLTSLVVSNLSAATVNVFAAASLTDSLKEIAAGYEKKTSDKIVFNFGASSTLARQIEEGAPDVCIEHRCFGTVRRRG